MKRFYYIATCDTCKRIMKTLQLPSSVELREIKNNPLTVKELERMHELAGSYNALFSRRAKLYKERGLQHEALAEDYIKLLILEHYTFLKRPVLVFDDEIFVGNSKKTVEEAGKRIRQSS